jgi:hypothetical protein
MQQRADRMAPFPGMAADALIAEESNPPGRAAGGFYQRASPMSRVAQGSGVHLPEFTGHNAKLRPRSHAIRV